MRLPNINKPQTCSNLAVLICVCLHLALNPCLFQMLLFENDRDEESWAMERHQSFTSAEDFTCLFLSLLEEALISEICWQSLRLECNPADSWSSLTTVFISCPTIFHLRFNQSVPGQMCSAIQNYEFCFVFSQKNWINFPIFHLLESLFIFSLHLSFISVE